MAKKLYVVLGCVFLIFHLYSALFGVFTGITQRSVHLLLILTALFLNSFIKNSDKKVAPNETRVFEPGMVMCVETPFYSSTRHTYNIEDTFVVTKTGIELFSRASPSLYL